MWLVNDIIVYTPPLVILSIIWFIFKKQIKPAGEAKHMNIGTMLMFFAAMYALVTLTSVLTQQVANYLSENHGAKELPDVFSEVMPKSPIEWLIMLFFVGIVAAVAEEIIFRHLLLKLLRRLGDRPAVIITAVAFGAFHGNLTQFFYAAVAGLILGIVTVQANSLKPAIVIHILNNSFDIGRAYLVESVKQGRILISEETLSFAVIAFLFVGLIATIVLAINGRFKI